MRFQGWVFTLVACLAIFFLVPTTTTEASFPMKEISDAKKDWTITFNQKVDPTTVSEQTIYIINDRGEKIDFSISHDWPNSAVVLTPRIHYNEGVMYTVVVTDQVKNIRGQQLKNTTERSFIYFNDQPNTPPPTESDTILSAIEKSVLDFTNEERKKAGLTPLQIDEKLLISAREKSTDMAENNYFSHQSPTFGSPFDQMAAHGITYKSAAENIALGYRTAEQVVAGWMDSPGHRRNMLNPRFTHIGIGFDARGNYWTQQFIEK